MLRDNIQIAGGARHNDFRRTKRYVEFPQLRAAIAAQALASPRRVDKAAQSQGKEAIADELLPALLGSAWRVSGASRWPTDFLIRHPLFDHGRLYRKRNSRGRATWDDAVAVAQPYLCDAPGDEALRMAAALAREDVAVWYSAVLSYWFPTRTVLVVAARHINPRRAAALGFIQVAGAPT